MRILELLFISTWVTIASADFYSAVEELENLSVNDEKLKVEYHKLVQDLEAVIVEIKKNIANIEKEQAVMRNDSLAYVTNPLNAFLLIKRLSVDAVKVTNKLEKVVKKFKYESREICVSNDDFEGAAEGLTRLQVFYGLENEDLANGIIQDQKYREELTAGELFTFGVFLLDSQRHTMSLSYLNLALERNRNTFDMSQIVILEEIYRNHAKTGNRSGMIETIDKMIILEPGNQDLDMKKLNIELEMLFENDSTPNAAPEPEVENKTKEDTDLKELKLLTKTCSGAVERTPQQLRFLRCHYASKSAFSKIAPFKLEEANLSPYIVIFHDVVSNNEIEFLKSESKPSLRRAKVLNRDKSERVDGIRTSKHSWHGDETNAIFERLTNRVIDMTGLNKDNFEEWQTQNYGIGGHYLLHHDYDEDELPFGQHRGNRIATMMLYLTDVERGGYTVFPYLRIRIVPKKGSAVFWYNLSTSGNYEYHTRHAACPVLVGSKWVANKWIRAFYQEWTRPCQLFPVTTDKKYFKNFFAKYSEEIL